jgi:transcriptional regulator with GAF, ATPase, and Fis domain
VPAAIDSERFAGQVDVEDLVEELLEARRRFEQGERRNRSSRAHLRRAVSAGRLLQAAARAVAQGPVEGESLRRLLGLVARALGGERAFLLASDAGELQVRAGADAEGRAVELPDFALSSGVVQRVLESGRPTLSSDARRDGRFSEMDSVRALDLRSIACVPLLQGARVIGALYVDDALTAGSFRRRDLRLLASVADLLTASGLPARTGEPAEPVPDEPLR